MKSRLRSILIFSLIACIACICVLPRMALGQSQSQSHEKPAAGGAAAQLKLEGGNPQPSAPEADGSQPVTSQDDAWVPAKTWVFAVGLMKFDSPNLESWSTDTLSRRLDEKLIDTLRTRGVPASQITFIQDSDATKDAVQSKLEAFMQRPVPGDTIIFYYGGHGDRDYFKSLRPTRFITYDTKEEWALSDIVRTIQRKCTAGRVLLMADCRFSGGLAEEVARQPGKVPIAVLTNGQPTTTQPTQWTFTQSLIDGFSGKSWLDTNDDGEITLQELYGFSDLDVAFIENQRVTFIPARPNVPREWVMSKAAGKRPPRAGERCEVNEDGRWNKAIIINSKPDKWLVTQVGLDDSHDIWVTEDKLRPYEPTMMKDGTAVDVLWEGKWYPARILKNELGLYYVSYKGYDAIDNEWVAQNRVKASR